MTMNAQAGPSRRPSYDRTDFSGTYANVVPEDSDEESSTDEELDYSSAQYHTPPSHVKGKSIHLEGHKPQHARANTSQAQSEKSKSSWVDLDLSVVVALVSPIGNWLTGGDHIRNLFIIVLLIFYLHQVIEVPWSLYQASLAHTPLPRNADADDQDETEESQVARLAHSELHQQELFFLSLTILSPLAGAVLLRYVLHALSGTDSLSWFSTALFVLATGLRPWSHLVSRLRERTTALHAAAQAAPHPSHAAELHAELDALREHVERLEGELAEVRKQAEMGTQLQEVCDDLSEALGEVDRAGGRRERKTEATQKMLLQRIGNLENGLVQIREQHRRDIQAAAGAIHLHQVWHSVERLIMGTAQKALNVPQRLWLWCASVTGPSTYPGSSPRLRMNGLAHAPNGMYAPRIRSPEHSPRVPRLPTIPEADASEGEAEGSGADSDDTYVSAPDPSMKRSRSRSSSGGKLGTIRRSKTLGEYAFEYAQGVMLWPYRTSVKVLVTVAPPAARILPRM
ncbi:hypothetical protein CERSUDRAFT_172068 [Gelatoporia subvermispora B]|uniref:Uncharacterized protein n=1 Tax=Ceriporiopsis subvermispora (strain B) TaxID=914234 RepID=M2QT56_CERS8|nr:hypothetical protein CERSUDRAFT_172068 [Gelatoporia subvermispora B]